MNILLNMVDAWVNCYMVFGLVGLFVALVWWLAEHK